MVKRVSWVKGMRLTDEILKASDNCHHEWVRKAYLLASAGRFGLLPSSRRFHVSISINKNVVDVEALDCLAITKDGCLIDIQYDSCYTSFFDTRVVIPETEKKELLLIVHVAQGEWLDMGDGFCHPAYSYGLQPADMPLADNALPVARLVDEYGWRIDDLDFVPPCLYVQSHPYYMAACEQFTEVLRQINASLVRVLDADCKVAVSVYWPFVQSLLITMDKDQDLMSPMNLLGHVQKCVGAFLCACQLDKIKLQDPTPYQDFVGAAYSYRHVHTKIKEGIALCVSLVAKVDKLGELEIPQPVATPQPAPQPVDVKKRKIWDGKVI